ILVIINLILDNDIISLFFMGNMLIIQIIGFTGFLLISWGYILLLDKWMKVQVSPKTVLSILLYAMLVVSYYYFSHSLTQQLFVLFTEGDGVADLFWGKAMITWGIYIAYTGFGLKWTIPSTKLQFWVVFIAYHALFLLIFITLLFLVVLLM